ncbi:hypothetical protein D3C71_928310 [compost metagenome]
MPEDNPAQRTRQKADRKTGKGQQGSLERVTAHREEQRAKHQCRRRAIQKKVIPFKRIAQHRGDHQLAHLLRVLAAGGWCDGTFSNDITHDTRPLLLSWTYACTSSPTV